MKITAVKTYLLRYQLREEDVFGYSQNWYTSRNAMIVEVNTNEGITGVGEAFGPPEVTSAIIEHVYKPYLMGKDPMDKEVIWEELYNKLRDHGQKGLSVEAISAVDIALWDIVGKNLNVPVHKLLGGAYRKKVKVYATGFYRKKPNHQTEDSVKEGIRYVEKNFKAFKIKIGFDIKEDVARVKAIREAVGNEILIMIDANHAYDASTAINVGRRMEPYEIYWFEEPVPPEDIEGYIEVKQALNIPIAAGEAEFTKFGFRHLISNRAVDIVQPDCCVTGGLTEAKKIATLAHAWNIQCVPHVWGSAIAIAAALQLIAALPSCPLSLNPKEPIFELDQSPNIFRENLVTDPPRIKDGYIEIPKKAGLGVTLNRDSLQRYAVKR